MFNSIFDLVNALVIRMRNDEGQTMAEYGILIGVIALIVIVAAMFLGSNIQSLFNSTGSHL